MSDTEKVILSIENDTSVRETIVAIIQSLGYTCLEAPNAFRAWDILKERVVDLILLDIHMPGARGNQFLRFIRDRDIHTPVIVISGYLQEEVIKEVAGMEVKAVMPKPIRVARLAEEIQKIFDSE